jgi:hypothetical protein
MSRSAAGSSILSMLTEKTGSVNACLAAAPAAGVQRARA